MKAELTPCYILHRRDYRESSLIIDVFSREYGRVDLVAKGAKKNKKQQGVNFDLYQKYLISWSARSDLGTLIDIEANDLMQSLEPSKMMSAFYMNEVTLKLLHKHESHPELFDCYEDTLKGLAKGNDEQVLLRYFEKNLLESLGYGLVLDHDIMSGESIDSNKDYIYAFESGPSVQNIDSLAKITVSGKTLNDLQNDSLFEEKNIEEAKLLMRTILKQYLGTKPLASRQLYQAYIDNKKIN